MTGLLREAQMTSDDKSLAARDYYTLSPALVELIKASLVRKRQREREAVHVAHVAIEVGTPDAIALMRRWHRQGQHRCGCQLCAGIITR